MVYGLNVKPEHGYYVGVEALDGDISRIGVADQTTYRGILDPPEALGRPVKTDFVPILKAVEVGACLMSPSRQQILDEQSVD